MREAGQPCVSSYGKEREHPHAKRFEALYDDPEYKEKNEAVRAEHLEQQNEWQALAEQGYIVQRQGLELALRVVGLPAFLDRLAKVPNLAELIRDANSD
jgi:hypothetical protein